MSNPTGTVRSSVQNGEIVLTIPFRTAERLTDVLAKLYWDNVAQEVRSEIYRHLHDPECEMTDCEGCY